METFETLFMNRLEYHQKRESKEIQEKVRQVFSSGRKFSKYVVQKITEPHHTLGTITPKDFGNDFSFNPFVVPSDMFALDLLTDSGTNRLLDEQKELAQEYKKLVPSIQMFSYARCTPRENLEQIFRATFGNKFNFYPTLQGRAAEKMLLRATIEVGLLQTGDCIVSNRPFDTTKGHIGAAGLGVIALTPITTPEEYYHSDHVFLGNIDEEKFGEICDRTDKKALLMTLTDNGGGGQPVSMSNFKLLVKKARENGLLVWVDACRIFENALFIKTFEDGYRSKTITEISQEILSLCDFATMSFKKMYSHSGGAILVNLTSESLSKSIIKDLDGSIKRQTTMDYGNGYRSYSGLTGETIVEIMTGLIVSADEEITGRRIAQVGHICCYMRQKYNFPIIAGGHALYLAADQVLPNVPLTDCPAEYLNAIIMKSLKVRGCGLGLLVYGGRVEEDDGKIKLNNKLSMDSLRLAIPRNQFSNDEILSRLMIIGEAFACGVFKQLNGGLFPEDYVDNGFYHFGAQYHLHNVKEFNNMVSILEEYSRKQNALVPILIHSEELNIRRE